MKITVKTNRLAIASFVSGLLALLLTFGLLLVRMSLFISPDGTLLKPTNPTLKAIEFWSPWVSRLGSIVTIGAILTGILALLEIMKKGGREKGKIFAWVGIILGAAWILFRVAIALFFYFSLSYSRALKIRWPSEMLLAVR
jgi:hypothetical protein